jgi:ABC-type dipeptide/oligopeptide/nickel transport system permease component
LNRYILRRLAVIPLALLLVNFAGFAYAHLVGPVQLANNPMFAVSSKPTPLLPAYWAYLKAAAHLDFGTLPPAGAEVGKVVLDAAVASFGLLTLALLVSVLIGSALGIKAVRNDPTRIAPWLTVITTAGLAMPGFYIGTLLIMAVLFYLVYGPATIQLPVQGFGWNLHLLLPTVVLAARPTAQLAQVTASLLAGEMDQQHILTARSVGVPLRTVRRKHALRNIIAPVAIAVFAALRLMVSELIVIEYIFSWPGLGRLLASILLAPRTGGVPGPAFLNPAALATTLTLLAAVFLLTDLAAGIVARIADPRLRAETHTAEEGSYQNA